MEQAKISIIVPVYQVDKYLRRCLDSIVNQTYKNLEIILVEDGSSDNSPAICEEYAQKDGRIIVIHQHNQGVSVARNTGLDMVTGDYIGFVDSDDWVELDMYEKLYKAIIENEADISIAGCYWETQRERAERPVDFVKYHSPTTMLEGTIFGKNIAISAVWSKLYRKKLFEITRFVPNVYSEDNICMVDLFGKSPKLAFVQDCCYHYNKMNDTSVTIKPTPCMEYGYFLFISKYLGLEEKFLTNEELVQQMRSCSLKRAIRCYIEDLVMHQMSEDRLAVIDRFLRDRNNYIGVDKLQARHRILCWCYNHCRWVLKWYAKIRY